MLYSFPERRNLNQGCGAKNVKTILIAEDDKGVRELLENLVISWGYLPVPVESAEQAIASIKEKEIDLVLTDELMPPGEDGWAVVNASRQLRPARQVVMISGSASPERATMESITLLPKPFMPKVLRMLVDRHLKPVTLADMYTLQAEVETSFRVQDSDAVVWRFFGEYFKLVRQLSATICRELSVAPSELTKRPVQTELGPEASELFRTIQNMVLSAKEELA